jgi:hypothetical protein
MRNTDTARTSQETLKLRYRTRPVNAVGETVAVCCENRTVHRNTLCVDNASYLRQMIQLATAGLERVNHSSPSDAVWNSTRAYLILYGNVTKRFQQRNSVLCLNICESGICVTCSPSPTSCILEPRGQRFWFSCPFPFFPFVVVLLRASAIFRNLGHRASFATVVLPSWRY